MAHLLRIKQNQIRMIKARGYDVSHDEWMFDVNFDEFKEKLIKQYGKYPLRKLLFSEYELKNKKEGDKTLFVYFVGLQDGKQIKLEAIDPFIFKMTEEDKDGILIINSTLSPPVLKRLSIITESKYQIFQEYEFEFDLINHIMVPKHELMTPSEVSKFKKNAKIKPKSLPQIPQDDIIVRYYNFPVGSYIKITSESEIDTLCDITYEHCIVV